MNFKKPGASSAPKPDIYEMVTTKILEKLEQGQIPWQKPWNIKTGSPCNIVTGKPYNGINVMLLGCQNYDSKYWMTFKQCIDKGGNVRKGEKGSIVVFWNFIDKSTGKSIESDTEKSSSKPGDAIPMLRYYTVFNVNQCDGLDLKRLREELEAQSHGQKHDELLPAQAIIDLYKDCPEIKYGYTKACYKPLDDVINMPRREHFKTPEAFFSTLYHEAIHSSGHENRLNRKNGSEARTFGDEAYSKEELVAEMGASFLCARAGIENTTIDNSAAYIQSWMAALKNDKKLLVTAAGQAQKAANYITGDIEPSKIKSLETEPVAVAPPATSTATQDIQKAVEDGRVPSALITALRSQSFGYTDEKLLPVIISLAENPNAELIAQCVVNGVISGKDALENMLIPPKKAVTASLVK
jgi:antirestriction protein ArdC